MDSASEPLTHRHCPETGASCGPGGAVYSTMRHNRDVVWHLLTMDITVDQRCGTGTGYYGYQRGGELVGCGRL